MTERKTTAYDAPRTLAGS